MLSKPILTKVKHVRFDFVISCTCLLWTSFCQIPCARRLSIVHWYVPLFPYCDFQSDSIIQFLTLPSSLIYPECILGKICSSSITVTCCNIWLEFLTFSKTAFNTRCIAFNKYRVSWNVHSILIGLLYCMYIWCLQLL